jgi:CPA1 family monovalent cation:H+ antiporter
MNAESIIFAVELIITLLAIAVAVGILARKLRQPFTVGLVIVGVLLLLISNWFREIEDTLPLLGQWLHLLDGALNFDDDVVRTIIMGLLVPPLIFEAAFHLNFSDVRRSIKPILLFAIPGVLITTFLVAGVVMWGAGIALPAALVFGSLIAATDPVAVVALFRSLGVPKRLAVLLEGESLMNDGTAIVLFGIALAYFKGASISFVSGITQFLLIAGGGLAIGLVFGFLAARLIARINDHLIETAITFILAFGAYTLAESIHVSGVLAVVAAGLMTGNLGAIGMSPTTKQVVGNFWEFTSFVANSLVFLLIGMAVELDLLFANLLPILYAIVAVLVARAIVIFGFSTLLPDVPRRWQIILYWGGLRGAISLALALTIGGNAELRAMAFGVVLFTLLVQGLTMGPLVNKLGITQRNWEHDLYVRLQGRSIAAQSARQHLAERFNAGMISTQTWQTVGEVLQKDLEDLKGQRETALERSPRIAAEEVDTAWREALSIQRKVLVELSADGILSNDLMEDMVTRIDAANQEELIDWASLEQLHTGLSSSEPDDDLAPPTQNTP